MRTVSYGTHPDQFAELTLPDDVRPGALCPIAVVVHGGFWKEEFDLGLGRPLARDLAAAGVAAWNVEYRRVGATGGGWPGTAEDVGAAVDLLAAVADTVAGEFAGPVLDLTRVVAIGHSAGGQLATLLPVRTGPVRVPVTGVVSQAGVLDLESAATAGLGSGAVARLLGGDPGRCPERYTVAAPITRTPIGVPVVCVHGDRDEDVPPSQSADFVERARAAGDTAELIMVEGADHYDLITVDHPAWTTCRGATLRLLGA